MRIAIIGCGSRHYMYLNALTTTYAQRHQLVALCDTNPHRLALAAAAAERHGRPRPATYAATDFAGLLAERRPDTVIVASPDHTHADTIVTALDAGAAVICEKPLAIDPAGLSRIAAAQARTGRRVTVTFNYRYSPARAQLRDILRSGAIGQVTAVDFRWMLDRVHGADYFRRWHRQPSASGSLLVHKSSHHFDLLNWWLGTVPATVSAFGRRAFYTPATAAALGLAAHGRRCAECALTGRCDFTLDLDADDNLRRLYREAEADDGYARDLCVFAEEIGIEDTIQALIRYASGATATYTLLAYAPWEGFEVTFLGTGGTLSHRHVEVHGIFGGRRPPGEAEQLTTVLHRANQAPEEIPVPSGTGDHGGADPLLLADLFDRTDGSPAANLPDHRDGTWSVLTGIAARRSIETGQPVVIRTLVEEAGIA